MRTTVRPRRFKCECPAPLVCLLDKCFNAVQHLSVSVNG